MSLKLMETQLYVCMRVCVSMPLQRQCCTWVSPVKKVWTCHWETDTHTQIYCTQTSVTSLPPEFTGNQLRLSKRGETYPPPCPPPPLWPSSDFISTFLQLFIPLLFLLLLHCHDFISTPLLFSIYLNAHFLSSPRQRRDRHAVISCS